MKKLYICMGCDTDPDRPGFVDIKRNDFLSWRGFEAGIPLLKEFLGDMRDSDNKPPKFTWLLRADEQIRQIYGDYGWFLNNYRTDLEKLYSSGDELGWHPHFYRYHNENKFWYQEINDIDFQINMLDQAYETFKISFDISPVSTRMGWGYHNNKTMRKLSDLGIKIDFSAIPGFKLDPPSDIRKMYNIYDWSITPQTAYFPSENDYRRGVITGEKRLRILEAPVSVSRSRLWSTAAGLHLSRKSKSILPLIQSLKGPAYQINITGSAKYFRPILSSLKKKLIDKNNKNEIFTAYFHADELLDHESKIYSRNNIKVNINHIIKMCGRLNVPYYFITAANIREILNLK